MATAEDLLKKAEARKKKGAKKFQPEKRRAWDYVSQNNLPNEDLVLSVKSRDASSKQTSSLEANVGELESKKGSNKKGGVTGFNTEDKTGDDTGNNREQQGSIQRTKQGTTGFNTGDKTGDKATKQELLAKLQSLSGLQENLLNILVKICVSRNGLETGFIRTETLCKLTESKKEAVRTALKRLIKKELVYRNKGKVARGGGLNLGILEKVKKGLLEVQSQKKLQEDITSRSGNEKVGTGDDIRSSIGDTASPYSSSNITTTKKKSGLPENWLEINLEPLKEIGFSLSQLKQLYSASLNTPEIVQDSINHFSFGLETNQKVKQYPAPLTVLMGVLRKGQAWVEQNYQSSKERAQLQLIERKKAERARLKQLEEAAYKLALEEWQETLTDEQIKVIAPPKKSKGDFMPQHVKLSMYFRENIWSGKEKEYLVG